MSYVRNILKVYDKATAEEVEAGISWYARAKSKCEVIAETNSLALTTFTGVVSALSPNNKWVRNINDATGMVQVYRVGGNVEEVTVCTYKSMRAKAWSILDGRVVDKGEVLAILNGQKIRAFAECILGDDTCVVDGHAYNIAHGKRLGLTEINKLTPKVFKELQGAYVRAGKRRGLKAYEMQACTWTAWRRTHNIK